MSCHNRQKVLDVSLTFTLVARACLALCSLTGFCSTTLVLAHLPFELLSRFWELYSLLGSKSATRKQELLMLTAALILFDRLPSNRNWSTSKTTSHIGRAAYRHVCSGHPLQNKMASENSHTLTPSIWSFKNPQAE